MNKKMMSLRQILLLAIIAIIIVQAVIFVALSHYAGAFSSLDSATLKYVNTAVSSKRSSVEATLLEIRSETDDEAEDITSIVSEHLFAPGNEEVPDKINSFSSLKGNSSEINSILTEASPVLKKLIDQKEVTGAFVILNTNSSKTSEKIIDSSSRSCIYLRENAEAGTLDILYGPTSLSSVKKINKSEGWKAELDFGENNNRSFYHMPALYEKKSSEYSVEDFGYWTKPFSLYENDKKIITYSLPIVSGNGEFYGVVGVEISEDYLHSIFTTGEISGMLSDTYIFSAASAMESDYLENSIILGGLTEKDLSSFSAGNNVVNSIDEAYHIQNDSVDFYAFTKPVSLYSSSSFFSDNDNWFFAGLVSGSYISGMSSSTINIVYTAMIISLLCSMLIVIVFVNILSSPVSKLVKELPALDASTMSVLDRTKIKEFDELAAKVEEYNSKLADYSSKTSKIIDLIDIPIATFEVSKTTDKVFVSKSIVNILSLNPALVINDYIDKREWEYIYENLTKVSNASYEGSFHINKGTDNEKWIKTNAFENDKRIIGILSDITDKVRERQRIEYERDYDAITGIINRRSFFVRAEELLPKYSTAVVTLWDIDNLKHINDKYGHAIGDKLIKAATLVLDSISEPEHILTARLSGDEFVTIIMGDEPVDSYRKQIDELYSLLIKVVLTTPDEEEIHIEASAGIACYPENASTVKELLKCSDYAIFRDRSEQNKRNNGISMYK